MKDDDLLTLLQRIADDLHAIRQALPQTVSDPNGQQAALVVTTPRRWS